MQQNPNNPYSFATTLQFFTRWWKVLLPVFIIALILSTVVAFVVHPEYRSTAVIIPSNSNRMSKAILAERYSLDFMDYGAERDCEYAIQILTSVSMEDSLIQHFKLTEHYGLKDDDPYKSTKTHNELRGKVHVKRTNNMGISISVDDVDPVFAADMANFMAEYYDTLCHRIHAVRAQEAYAIMQQLCDDVAADIAHLDDSLRTMGGHNAALSQLIADKCEELASLQTRTSQTKVDLNQNIHYKFTIDRAQPADKKFAPKRSLIILGGVASTLAIAILLLLWLGTGSPRKQSETV